MQRGAPEHADLLLDTWGWQCTRFTAAQTIHRTLAGYKGAHWPDWLGTVQRLTGAPASADAGGKPRPEEARR